MKILVVEDTEDSRILLEDNLLAQGYDVISTKNGLEALQQLHQSRFDLIVSDILMPEMDGFELCRIVKSNTELATIPFIFYTATYTSSRDENLALTLGADRFVVKPQNPEKLIDIIESVLAEGKFAKKAIKATNHELDEMHIDSLNRKLNKKVLELEEQKEQLQVITDALPVLISEVGEDGCYRYVNKAYESIYHVTRDKIVGKHLRDMLGEKGYEVIQPHVKKALKGERVSFEANIPFENGEECYIHAQYIPYGHLEQSQTGFFALVSDITERKKLDDENMKLHQEISKHEREQRQILDGIIDAVITIDESGRILTFNRSAEKMFSYPKKEAVGESISLLIPDTDKIRHVTTYFQPGDARIVDRNVTAQRKDGTTFPMHLSVTEYPSESDAPRHFIASLRDITTKNKQEEQLRRSSKMDALGKLTGGIAHDYNNSLGIILGFASLLEDALSEQPELASYAHEISRAGERGARLTKSLLAFSRQKSVNAESIDINMLLQEEKHMLEKTLTARIKLTLDLTEKLWLVKLDSGDLENAILNICINAMHAIDGNGELTFQTSNEQIDQMDARLLQIGPGDYVLLSFTDTGCGMDEKTKEKLFDPFFTTKGEEGTGLGLSQVYGFVERSGGAIKVFSELGQGTCLAIYLPRYNKKSAEQQEKEAENTADLSGRETILVVDDEPALLTLTTRLLSQQGYNTLSAGNCDQALKILEHENVDLLLSDVIMPEMDGYQLAAIVQEKYPKTIIQLASGFDEDRHVNVVDKTLHENLLHKPYNTNALLERMRELLG